MKSRWEMKMAIVIPRRNVSNARINYDRERPAQGKFSRGGSLRKAICYLFLGLRLQFIGIPAIYATWSLYDPPLFYGV